MYNVLILNNDTTISGITLAIDRLKELILIPYTNIYISYHFVKWLPMWSPLLVMY